MGQPEWTDSATPHATDRFPVRTLSERTGTATLLLVRVVVQAKLGIFKCYKMI